jgi:hypothetical protein
MVDACKNSFNDTLKFSSDGVELLITTKRVIPDTTYAKGYSLIPIQNSAYWKVGRLLAERPLILPKLYAALTFLTGPGDSNYDDFKGSFSFSFELKVNKNDKVSRYFLHLYHVRSHIEFALYQVIPEANDIDTRVMRSPDPELFSEADIENFSIFFCAFFNAKAHAANYTPNPFVKFSDSDLLLFGFCDNEYFYTQHKNREKFEEEKKRLEAKE